MSITLKIIAPVCIAAAFCLIQPAGAQATESVEDARVSQMQTALQACGNVAESRILEICETSLSTVLDMQPKLEFIHEAVVSYYVESILRDTLAKTYFAQGSLNKHCENMEKIWLAKHNASQYSDHPIYPEILNIAMMKQKDVATCRKLGGTPNWGAPL